MVRVFGGMFDVSDMLDLCHERRGHSGWICGTQQMREVVPATVESKRLTTAARWMARVRMRTGEGGADRSQVGGLREALTHEVQQMFPVRQSGKGVGWRQGLLLNADPRARASGRTSCVGSCSPAGSWTWRHKNKGERGRTPGRSAKEQRGSGATTRGGASAAARPGREISLVL